MKRAKKPVWEIRRAHLRMTAMRRGGMPEPGSFEAFFFGGAAAGAAGGTATAPADAATWGD
jgi:hypothetical protein